MDEKVDSFRYHRVRTPSWAVGGETSFGEDAGRSTSRQQLRSVESAPCRVDAGVERYGTTSLRVSRRSISRDSRDLALERAVSFTAAVAAAEAASSTSGSSNLSPAAVQECAFYPAGIAAMAHNRTPFGSTDEQITCVDVVDLSEEFLTQAGEVKTHTRTRSSADEYFAAVSEVRGDI